MTEKEWTWQPNMSALESGRLSNETGKVKQLPN